MSESASPPASVLDRLKTGLLLLCLFAPSAWMIATLPPLWRDADAYNQLVQDPLVATYWGHGPAYCYLAKVPLFIGEQIERLWAPGAAASRPESSQPALTDTGVWLLVIGQHLALGAASFYFISSISAAFRIRLALALVWASNALFYTFAHCVGTETLSMIFIILLAAQSIRLMRPEQEAHWMEWYIFAGVLLGCILSRHLNLCLVALLPTALLLSWSQKRASEFFSLNEVRRDPARVSATDYLRQAAIALAIGFACLAVAHFTVQSLARKTRLHPHSRIGFTFLWRLRFLEALPPQSRTALLQKVTARTHSADAQKLLALLQEMQAEGLDLQNWKPFMDRAIQFFGGPLHWERLDAALNQMALAFLIPPVPQLFDIAWTDFLAALKTPSTEVSSYVFDTTAYYFEHKSEMAACRNLVTFRDTTVDKIAALPAQHLYLHFWKGVTYNKAFVLWFIALAAFVLFSRWRSNDASGTIALGITLPFLGLVMFASSCLLVDDQPRFRLPMWQLLLLSLYLLAGRTADLATAGSNRGMASSIDRKQSAGQLPTLG